MDAGFRYLVSCRNGERETLANNARKNTWCCLKVSFNRSTAHVRTHLAQLKRINLHTRRGAVRTLLRPAREPVNRAWKKGAKDARERHGAGRNHFEDHRFRKRSAEASSTPESRRNPRNGTTRPRFLQLLFPVSTRLGGGYTYDGFTASEEAEERRGSGRDGRDSSRNRRI